VKQRLLRVSVIVAAGAVAATLWLGLASTTTAQTSAALTQKSPDAAEIQSTTQSGGTVRVMVLYQTPQGPARANIGTPRENIAAIVSENHAA
jgi:hypothetical protein